ncbi:hypothetical protein Taro_036678 [Colocasia esculenta]|uniref:Late embryogenesis abundant protein Lea5 n=1 Tax=Colocasia esculenta TaxID=4460 RepID=A0A843WH16_COLES|nr:hypothetical protein [Colocasia esculenta]
MARSVSQAARLAVKLSESAGVLLVRRTYSAAAAPSGVVRRVEEKAVAPTSSKSKKTGGAAEPSAVAWVPDPDTGYYRPANRPAELDAAEMRQRLLSRRFHH